MSQSELITSSKEILADFAGSLEVAGQNADLAQHVHSFNKTMSELNISALIADELDRSSSSHEYSPRVRTPDGLNLWDGSWFVIELSLLESPEYANPTSAESSDSIYYFISSCECATFELQNYRNDDYTSSARAIKILEQTLDAGTTLCIKSDNKLIAVKSEIAIAYAVVRSKKRNLFGWDFDLTTGEPVLHYNNFPVATALELIAVMLGTYADASATPTLEKLLEHRSDTVKWEAARALAKVNPEAAKRALLRLAQSSHSQLAAAAKKSLSTIES